MFEGCTDLETIAAIDTTATLASNSDMFDFITSLTSPNSGEQTSIRSASGFDFN
ncbi:hypothetical protein [uncultured Paraglaciecola sp.]|uniref:hypothetical protein n=1 Tax=uncultured Paraglaciecola sp. TaxID=1765024 RepID=UPI0026287FD2|nr:hypothetical protein [uncultured Paraglaciecola sp.]